MSRLGIGLWPSVTMTPKSMARGEGSLSITPYPRRAVPGSNPIAIIRTPARVLHGRCQNLVVDVDVRKDLLHVVKVFEPLDQPNDLHRHIRFGREKGPRPHR